MDRYGLEKILKIKVKQIISSDSKYPFVGETNLEVRGTGCAGYYRSSAPQLSKEAALQDAIRGFLLYYSEDAAVRKVRDW
jgi:hypothetical protein